MFRTLLAVAILAAVTAFAVAQSASAPLMVTAEVVRSCKVDVPLVASPNQLSTLPVTVTCARSDSPTARVERPVMPSPRRIESRGAVVVIQF
jgi:hypothetical protein